MMTRRTVLGAGLALTAVACSTAFGAPDPTARRRDARAVDALLVDETIELPRQLSAYIKARSLALPVIGIQLDAASHGGLKDVLNRSQVIVGISSGATLFCLERIAWDHGLRLTERSQRGPGDPGDDACCPDVAALLSGAHPLAATSSQAVRAYRPSRGDGTLHTWAMRKHVASRFNPGRQET